MSHEIKFSYINNFINFTNDNNKKYLSANINPFINYGLELLNDNKGDIVQYNPISYKYKENNKLPSNMFQTNKNLYELLTIWIIN